MPPSGDNTVRLGVQFEGVADAERGLQALQQAIDNLNQSSVAVPGTSGPTSGYSGPSSVLSGAPGAPGFSAPGTALPAGFGAPPAPGVMQNPMGPGYNNAPPAYTNMAMNGTAGNSGMNYGTTIVQAGNVTIQAGSITGLGGGSGSPASMTTSMPGFNASAAGSNAPPAPGVSPVPNWSPFGGNWTGFTDGVYNRLEQSGGLQGAIGGHFLQNNAMGRQAMGLGANLSPFLGESTMAPIASFLGAAAPVLAGVALAGEAIKGGLDIYGRSQRPLQYQRFREEAYGISGNYYDPIKRSYDQDIAQFESIKSVGESMYNTPMGQVTRLIPGVSYYHDFVFEPAAERKRMRLEADRERREGIRSLYQSTGMVDSSDQLQGRTGLSRELGAYAYGQRGVISDFDYQQYGSNEPLGFSPDQVNRSYSTITNTLSRPGYESLQRGFLRGNDARGSLQSAIAQSIYSGDQSSLLAMRPDIAKATGSVDSAQKAINLYMEQMLTLSGARTSGQLGQYGLGSAMSSVQFLEMSGGSYRSVARAESGITAYDTILQSLQTERSAAQNPLEQARLDEQISQVQNQRFGTTRRDPAMRIFAGRGLEASTAGAVARNQTQSALFGGSYSDVIGGFSSQSAAMGQQESILRDQARSMFYSPEQRRQFSADAEQIGLQRGIFLPRERGSYIEGLAQAGIGISSSNANTAITTASLFGGISDTYRASLGQAGITGQQLALTNRELSGEFGPRTQQERLSLQERQIDLQRQLNQSIEEAKRQFASASLGVAQFRENIGQSGSAYRIQFLGEGGAQAGIDQSANVANARRTLSVAQRNFDTVAGLPKDNAYRQQREQELQSARIGAQSATQEIARLPYSVGLEREQMAGQFRLSTLGRTYASFGDIRGTVQGLMSNVASRGDELRSLRKQGIAEIDRDTSLSPSEREQRKSVFLRDIEGRQYALGSEAVGYQSQLENGWQDRLISSVVGMPERGAFVASQFTRREAASFLQTQTSVFGFSGQGATTARDYYRDRGGRLANSLIGAIQRPEGFNETAMSGTSGVLQGTMTIRVVVEDTKGNRLGRGETAGTLHDLFNTKNINTSAYTSGMGGQ